MAICLYAGLILAILAFILIGLGVGAAGMAGRAAAPLVADAAAAGGAAAAPAAAGAAPAAGAAAAAPLVAAAVVP